MNTHVILKKYFDKKKADGRGFSLRGLAKKMNVSPSFLTRVLKGEKSVPPKLLESLKIHLDIEPEVFSALLEQQPKKSRKKVDTQLETWQLTETNSQRILRQWFYLAILEFITLKDFNGEREQIAKRLGLGLTTVEVALNEMISLGLIEVDNGRLKKTTARLRWGSAKSLAVIRNFHDQMLEKAQEELRTKTSDEDYARRLISGITISAPRSKIEAAKQRLNECLHEIANDLTSDEDGTEVYQLSAQLFPLTTRK